MCCWPKDFHRESKCKFFLKESRRINSYLESLFNDETRRSLECLASFQCIPILLQKFWQLKRVPSILCVCVCVCVCVRSFSACLMPRDRGPQHQHHWHFGSDYSLYRIFSSIPGHYSADVSSHALSPNLHLWSVTTKIVNTSHGTKSPPIERLLQGIPSLNLWTPRHCNHGSGVGNKDTANAF